MELSELIKETESKLELTSKAQKLAFSVLEESIFRQLTAIKNIQ